MHSLLKEQGIWAPLSGLPSKIDKSVLSSFDNSLVSIDEVLYEVSEEQTTYELTQASETLHYEINMLQVAVETISICPLNERSVSKRALGQVKLLMELYDIDAKIEDKDLAMILLASFPRLYENFMSSLCVGKDSITLEASSVFIRESFDSKHLEIVMKLLHLDYQ